MNAGGRLSSGQRFGAYLVEACVGEGGMGAVYRATDTKLGRTVALKVIRPDPDSGPSADTIARFLRESRVGASLAHPNIVTVFEAGATDNCPYIAMEWIDGASLAHLMDDPSSLPPAHRLDILDAVADALAHAHARGVIHRDVKPTNVMIDGRGRARLVDFGIARPTKVLAAATQMLPTHARALLGTPAYMAPEQMLSPSVDGRADQFSWGVMAYELLSGEHPNETVPPDGSAFPIAKPTPLGWLRADVPEALAAVVHRSISYEPGTRFGTMDELVYAWRTARGAGRGASASTPAPYVPQLGGPPATAYGATVRAHHADPSTVARQYTTVPPMPAMSNAHAVSGASASRKFPWIAIVAALGAVVVVLGVGLVIVATGLAPGSLRSAPSLPGSPLALAPRAASVENDDLEFVGPAAEIAKAKSALDSKLLPCMDGRVASNVMFTGTIFVTADGRVTKATELEICKEQHPSFYLCTERTRAATPKNGYPTVPEATFVCVEKALLAARLPRVKVDPGETTTKQDLHIQVR